MNRTRTGQTGWRAGGPYINAFHTRPFSRDLKLLFTVATLKAGECPKSLILIKNILNIHKHIAESPILERPEVAFSTLVHPFDRVLAGIKTKKSRQSRLAYPGGVSYRIIQYSLSVK